MTEFLLILGGFALGAICFGVGYLIGKKKKVVAQIQAGTLRATGAVKDAVDKASEKAIDMVGKI